MEYKHFCPFVKNDPGLFYRPAAAADHAGYEQAQEKVLAHVAQPVMRIPIPISNSIPRFVQAAGRNQRRRSL
jgi:hypothetical protein